jgi:AAA family ATP:ADP antiporter
MTSAPSAESPAPQPPRQRNWIATLVDVKPGEGVSLALSTAYFFTLLAGYLVLKPVREAMGISGGADRLPVLFSFTMLLTIIVVPAFARFITRVPRRVFIPVVYGISIGCLLLFRVAFALVPESHELWVGYPYFVFVSVFNLFVVSIFWSFMADLWTLEQAKRLYGFIGAGGTLGAIAGSFAATTLAKPLHSVNLLFISVAMLLLSIVCVRALFSRHGIDRASESGSHDEAALKPVPTSADTWRGIQLVWTHPYLRTIASYTFLYGLIGTFLYFQQGHVVEHDIPDRDGRTRYFGLVDLLAQSATGIIQVFFTGRLIKRLGIGFALNTQPVIAFASWCALAAMLLFGGKWFGADAKLGEYTPVLWMLIAVQVLLRASNYATARPARESLFTVVGREMKYKSKSFIDTFVYRAADFTGGWAFTGLRVLGAATPVIAVITIPLTGVWILVGRALGRRQRELVAESSAAEIVGNQTSASKSAATA